MIPAREWKSAGKASGTSLMVGLLAISDSRKLRSSVGATGSRNSYPEPSLAGDSPVESGRINDDSEVRKTLVRFSNQPTKASVNLGQVTENLGDTHYSKVFGVYNRVATGGPHAVSTHAKKLQRRIAIP